MTPTTTRLAETLEALPRLAPAARAEVRAQLDALDGDASPHPTIVDGSAIDVFAHLPADSADAARVLRRRITERRPDASGTEG